MSRNMSQDRFLQSLREASQSYPREAGLSLSLQRPSFITRTNITPSLGAAWDPTQMSFRLNTTVASVVKCEPISSFTFLMIFVFAPWTCSRIHFLEGIKLMQLLCSHLFKICKFSTETSSLTFPVTPLLSFSKVKRKKKSLQTTVAHRENKSYCPSVTGGLGKPQVVFLIALQLLTCNSKQFFRDRWCCSSKYRLQTVWTGLKWKFRWLFSLQ